MTTVINRSFADNMGWNWSADIVAMVDGEPVTVHDVRRHKRERQQRHLARKRETLACWRAAQVCVFYVPCFPYQGWHVYLRTHNQRWYLNGNRPEHWIVPPFADIKQQIMRTYSFGLLPLRENFRTWKETFARTYGKPRDTTEGIAYGWVWIEHSQPRHYKPAEPTTISSGGDNEPRKRTTERG